MEQTVNGDESPHGEEAQSPQPKKEELKKIGNFIVGKPIFVNNFKLSGKTKGKGTFGKVKAGTH